MTNTTDQELFWQGSFGNEYTDRNRGVNWIASNTAFFTKGVLIHINPDKLSLVYDIMYKSSSRYILVSEYYNPCPVDIKYRGHSEKLFKRDFACEMLDQFPDLRLINYGFVYHRDPNFPQDDMTWFLMEEPH